MIQDRNSKLSDYINLNIIAMRSSEKTAMTDAIRKLVEESQEGYPGPDNGRKPMRSAVIIGTLAYRIHRVIVSLPFKILFILGLAYLALRLAGITVQIIRNGDVILSIR